MFLIQLVAKILVFYKFQNLIISHLYFILQFLILSFFYKSLIKNHIQLNIIKLTLIFFPAILGIQYLNYPSLINSFNLFEIVCSSFLVVTFASFHFYNLLNIKKEFYIFSIGLVIYLFGSTFLFLFMDLIAKNKLLNLNIVYSLNSIIYIIYQIFIFMEWKTNYSKS